MSADLKYTPEIISYMQELWAAGRSCGAIGTALRERFPSLDVATTAKAIAGVVYRLRKYRGFEFAPRTELIRNEFGKLAGYRHLRPTQSAEERKRRDAARQKAIREEKRRYAAVEEAAERTIGIVPPDDRRKKPGPKLTGLPQRVAKKQRKDPLPTDVRAEESKELLDRFAAPDDLVLYSLFDLTDMMCHWPLEREGKTFYCGRNCSGRYCVEHTNAGRNVGARKDINMARVGRRASAFTLRG